MKDNDTKSISFFDKIHKNTHQMKTPQNRSHTPYITQLK